MDNIHTVLIEMDSFHYMEFELISVTNQYMSLFP